MLTDQHISQGQVFSHLDPPHLLCPPKKMDTEIDHQDDSSFSNTETNGIILPQNIVCDVNASTY